MGDRVSWPGVGSPGLFFFWVESCIIVDMERLLTSHDVAALTGFSSGTIENWRYIGKGPPWIRVGRSVRYPENLLADWIKEQHGPEDETPRKA